ncbi:hypothetical protein CJ202_06600 [Corynebacterium parakroppenstedtii]|nr:hypothetical protein CJ202_06600 [Corynebacterium kroppenstedtii]
MLVGRKAIITRKSSELLALDVLTNKNYCFREVFNAEIAILKMIVGRNPVLDVIGRVFRVSEKHG